MLADYWSFARANPRFLLFGYLSAIRTAFTAGIDVADLDRLIVRHKVSLIQMLQ